MSVPVHKNDRILIVDDDPEMVSLVENLTSGSTASITAASTLGEGVRLAAEQRFDIIILEHLLPDGLGLDRVSELLSQDRLRPILYTTAQAGASTVIEAIQRGAFDYFTKPLDAGLLKQRLREALEYRRLTRLPVLVDGAADNDQSADVLVGRSRGMQEVYKSIGRMSALDAPVLIEGEVGTGKETIARAIHRYGPRRQQCFAKITSEELAALLQCRDARGSSAMALEQILPQCAGGTLLLEELGSLSWNDQSRLLASLQSQAASTEPVVRMILSTSVPSRQLLETGLLRSDLYYFLNPYKVRLPALRERGDDFELLVAHFMQQLTRVAATNENQGPPRVSPAAMELLRGHDWPGNLAQLKSVLQSVLLESRGAVLATAKLCRDLLDGGAPDTLPCPAAPAESRDSSRLELTASCADVASTEALLRTERLAGDLQSAWDLSAFVRERLSGGADRLYADSVAELEQTLLVLVLQHTHGNQAQAAKHLGITRTSLRKKIALARIDLARIEHQSDSRTSLASRRSF